MRRFALAIGWAALGSLFFGAVPVTAQPAEPAQTTLGQRIEAAAKAALNSPRLKGLTEKQRIDWVEFVAGNTLVLLSHELGHVLIAEMHLPLLGREEDAADTYAALRMLTFGTSFSQHELAQAAQGWFLNDRRDQEIGEKPRPQQVGRTPLLRQGGHAAPTAAPRDDGALTESGSSRTVEGRS